MVRRFAVRAKRQGSAAYSRTRSSHMLRAVTIGAGFLLFVTIGTVASAAHVPLAIDVPIFRPDTGGYLEFINPTEHPGAYPAGIPVPTSPPGVILTEEHTGFTAAPLPLAAYGLDTVELGDSHVTHGDRADFDWVQEHRDDEFADISNHPGMVGAMGWGSLGIDLVPGVGVFITPTEASPHVDPGTGLAHGHSVAETPAGTLPELLNPDFEGFFSAVDIFSIISIEEDGDIDAVGLFSPRDAALDYVVDFANTLTGAFSPGIPTIAWVPGWTGASGSDDWVARWVPADGGVYNVVAIEPASGLGHDGIVEIDAIKAIPEPSTMVLACLGLATIVGMALRRRKRA